jgi:hypothetical protein
VLLLLLLLLVLRGCACRLCVVLLEVLLPGVLVSSLRNFPLGLLLAACMTLHE